MIGIVVWIIIIIVIMNYNKNNQAKLAKRQRVSNTVSVKPKNSGTVKSQQDLASNRIRNQNIRNSEAVQNAKSANGSRQNIASSGSFARNNGTNNSVRQPLSNAEQAKQAELKRRLQQRYGNTANWKQQSKMQQTGSWLQEQSRTQKRQEQNIFDKAYENVQEDFSQNTYYDKTPQDPDDSYAMVKESELMRKVQDLIVVGYQGNMRYERDFIGEAEDMLNRFL